MRISARALIVEDGKLLVFERERRDSSGKLLNYVSIPGGALEAGEDPELAVVRELREELSIDVEPIQLVAHLKVKATKWFHAEEHYFYVCRRVHGEPHFNPESDEAQKSVDQKYIMAWRSLDDMDAPPGLHPIYAEVMRVVLPYLKSGSYPSLPLDINADNLL